MFVSGRGTKNDFKENFSSEGLLFWQKFVIKVHICTDYASRIDVNDETTKETGCEIFRLLKQDNEMIIVTSVEAVSINVDYLTNVHS